MRRKHILFALISVMLAVPLINSAIPDWTIKGESVYINDSNAFINVTPHTITTIPELDLEVISKQYSGDIDIVLGFDSEKVKPVYANLYNPRYEDIEKSYNCNESYYYNYTMTPKHFWCWKNISKTEHILLFNHSFESFDLDKREAYWNEQQRTNFTSISSQFSAIAYEYKGMNKWYFAENLPVTAGVKYNLKIGLQLIDLTEKEKYSIAIKPSSETIQQAIANNHFYLLDPWITAKTNIELSETIFDSFPSTHISIASFDSERAVIVYRTLSTGYAIVVNESGVSETTRKVIFGDSIGSPSVAAFDNERALLTFEKAGASTYYMIINKSASNETAETQISGISNDSRIQDVVTFNNNLGMIVYIEDNTEKLRILTVDSAGVENISTTRIRDSARVCAIDNFTEKLAIIAFEDENKEGRFTILTKGGSIINDSIKIYSNFSHKYSVSTFDSSTALISFSDNESDYLGKYAIVNSDGKVLLNGTEFSSNRTYVNSNFVVESLNTNVSVIYYADNETNGTGRFVIINKSGSILNNSKFNNGRTTIMFDGVANLDSARSIIAFSDSDDGDKGKYMITNISKTFGSPLAPMNIPPNTPSLNYPENNSNISVTARTIQLSAKCTDNDTVEDDTEDSYAGNTSAISYLERAVDENWTSYADINTSGLANGDYNEFIYENYTNPTTYHAINWTVKNGCGYGSYGNGYVYYWNYSAGDWQALDFPASTAYKNLSATIPADALYGSYVQIRTNITATVGVFCIQSLFSCCGDIVYYEGKLTGYYDNLTAIFYVNETANPTNNVANSSKAYDGSNLTASYTIPSVLGTYYWRARCWDETNYSESYSTEYMFTLSNQLPVFNQNYTIPRNLNTSEDFFNITVNISDADAGTNFTYVNLSIKSPDGKTQLGRTNMTYIANDIWNYTTAFKVNDTGRWNFTVNVSDGYNTTSFSWLKKIFLGTLTINPSTHHYYAELGGDTESWLVRLTHNATETINYTYSYRGFLDPARNNATANFTVDTVEYLANRTLVDINETQFLNISIFSNASIDAGTYYGGIDISTEEAGTVTETINITLTVASAIGNIIRNPTKKNIEMYSTSTNSWTLTLSNNGKANLTACNLTTGTSISAFTTLTNLSKGAYTNFNITNTTSTLFTVTHTNPPVNPYVSEITIMCVASATGGLDTEYVYINLTSITKPSSSYTESGGGIGSEPSGGSRICNIEVSPESIYLSATHPAEKVTITNYEGVSISPDIEIVGDLQPYLMFPAEELIGISKIGGNGGEGSFVVQAINYEQFDQVLNGSIIITPSEECADINISISWGVDIDPISRFIMEQGGLNNLYKSNIGGSEIPYWLIGVVVFILFETFVIVLWRTKRISFKLKRTILFYLILGALFALSAPVLFRYLEIKLL